jgi:ribosome-associated heat shock protein Hsp15
MRIDKYLWCIRAFKTRSLATQHCREGKVSLNDKQVKPSLELKGGEVIRVRKGAVFFEWQVLDFPRSRMAAARVAEFARDITPESQLHKLEEIRAAQRDLLRPVGRPTKRDRRDWEKYFDD